MNDANKYTLSELENFFADDFSSPLFYELATRYFNQNDFSRAIKVLKIGLDQHSNHINGRYFLAKIYLLRNEESKAEKILNNMLKDKLYSPKTLKLLIEIRDTFDRSKTETKKIVDLLLSLYSDDAYAIRWANDYDTNYNTISKTIAKQDLTFKINENIASFTLYNVLKEQRYYNQAEKVLDILESTNQINTKLYQKEQAIIAKLISS